MAAGYGQLLRTRYAARLLAGTLVGRLPNATGPLAVVLFARAEGGSYALAGALSAVYGLCNAVGQPLLGRAVDRYGQPRIMLPMVVSLSELRRVRELVDEIARERKVAERVSLGVMIETPASAILSDQLSREADFISIGTNDLTQYTLAMDRGNANLAPLIDAFHPAVLRLIAEAARGARANGKPAGMCGGLAADPLAAPLLLGLGIDEFSVPPSAIPTIKATIRSLDMERCREAAVKALQQTTPEAVRAVAKEIQS